jgi:hypothetical protein
MRSDFKQSEQENVNRRIYFLCIVALFVKKKCIVALLDATLALCNHSMYVRLVIVKRSNHFAKKIIYTINNSNFPNRLQIILLHKHRIRLHESRFVLFIYLLFIVYLGYKYKKIIETKLIKTC